MVLLVTESRAIIEPFILLLTSPLKNPTHTNETFTYYYPDINSVKQLLSDETSYTIRMELTSYLAVFYNLTLPNDLNWYYCLEVIFEIITGEDGAGFSGDFLVGITGSAHAAVCDEEEDDVGGLQRWIEGDWHELNWEKKKIVALFLSRNRAS
ncbi:hypothetical protein GW17_00028841 [Ensete ventricosum]|nr:hypothetical protein GW17_00028841 [Ensete ventricosum]